MNAEFGKSEYLSSAEKEFFFNATSLASEQHPDRNEDAVLSKPEGGLYGVFDGLGGHIDGDKASQSARDNILKNMENIPPNVSVDVIENQMRNALLLANKNIADRNEGKVGEERMGTTASVVKIWEGKNGEKKAIIGNVGDSRVYIQQANGKLEQITLDDNQSYAIAKNEKEARTLQEKFNNITNKNELNENEIGLYKNRNIILQSLGDDKIKPHIFTIDLKPGDKIIVSSDGIHDNLTDIEMENILKMSYGAKNASENLTRKAQGRSRDKEHFRKKPDDMSAVVIEIPATDREFKKNNLLNLQKKEQGDANRERPITYNIGNVVTIKRSNGDIENDWKIKNYNNNNTITVEKKVIKNGETSYLEKTISRNELLALNKPEKNITIQSAHNFTELFKALNAKTGLQGSKEFFEREKLKDIINEIRRGKATLNELTQTEGLRRIVQDLIEIEDIQKRLQKLKKAS